MDNWNSWAEGGLPFENQARSPKARVDAPCPCPLPTRSATSSSLWTTSRETEGGSGWGAPVRWGAGPER